LWAFLHVWGSLSIFSFISYVCVSLFVIRFGIKRIVLIICPKKAVQNKNFLCEGFTKFEWAFFFGCHSFSWTIFCLVWFLKKGLVWHTTWPGRSPLSRPRPQSWGRACSPSPPRCSPPSRCSSPRPPL
jgi:hypothetical protein